MPLNGALYLWKEPAYRTEQSRSLEGRIKFFSDRCIHVPSGQVCADDEENKVCPLMALCPVRVLAGKAKMEIIPTDVFQSQCRQSSTWL